MQAFVHFLRGFLDLGATVILPAAIFILGLFFGQKPGKAFRSGLTIGVAFVGIFLVVDLLTQNLGPAAQSMVDRLAGYIIDCLGISGCSIYYSARLVCKCHHVNYQNNQNHECRYLELLALHFYGGCGLYGFGKRCARVDGGCIIPNCLSESGGLDRTDGPGFL
jgi:hypothetical protein